MYHARINRREKLASKWSLNQNEQR
jgi:hypothetical protein